MFLHINIELLSYSHQDTSFLAKKNLYFRFCIKQNNVYSLSLVSINSCFKLPDHCNVFQAELTAIKLVADALLECAASLKEVYIHSNNRAAIQALKSLTVSSKLVEKYMTSLAVASSYFHIKLVWVSGHSGINRNCKANEQARKDSLTQILSEWEQAAVCLYLCILAMDLWDSRKLTKRWFSTSTCGVAKTFWPRVERKRSMEWMFTGHCPIGTYAGRLKILGDVTCESCKKKVEVEITFSTAFARPSLKHLVDIPSFWSKPRICPSENICRKSLNFIVSYGNDIFLKFLLCKNLEIWINKC